MALLPKTVVKIAYRETKTYADDLEDDISFILRVGRTKRICSRSASGRETPVQQTTISKENAIELDYKIAPNCLVNEARCRGLVDLLLRFNGIPDSIRDCVVPSIYKEAMELTRYREEEGGRGFLIVTEVEVIEETWISEVIDNDDSGDHHRKIQTEQDSCAICLEALGESSTMELLCSHSFHKDCLFQWLGRNLSCPICRCEEI